MIPFTATTDDGVRLALRRWPVPARRAVLICAHAMMARSTYLRAAATALAEQGVECWTFDFRGDVGVAVRCPASCAAGAPRDRVAVRSCAARGRLPAGARAARRQRRRAAGLHRAVGALGAAGALGLAARRGLPGAAVIDPFSGAG